VTHQGTNPGGKVRVICAVAALSLAFIAVAAKGQAADVQTSNPPGTKAGRVVDSATAGPSNAPAPNGGTDTSAQSSPVSGTAQSVYVPVNTEINVRLQQSADSAQTRNGEMIGAMLIAPVKCSDGKTLPAGTPVKVTVLASAPAGKIDSRGELTLQVTHVGTIAVMSDAQTFFGQEGHKDLPDAAPAKGTEANVATGTTLKFHVAPTS
jgi:hypothetical protein